jgi:hypothetical protein
MGCLKLTYDYEKEPTLKCVWNKNRDGGHNSTIDKPDPFTQAPEYTQSYNRYSYAFNNPLLFTDPSGFVAGGPDSTETTGGFRVFVAANDVTTVARKPLNLSLNNINQLWTPYRNDVFSLLPLQQTIKQTNQSFADKAILKKLELTRELARMKANMQKEGSAMHPALFTSLNSDLAPGISQDQCVQVAAQSFLLQGIIGVTAKLFAAEEVTAEGAVWAQKTFSGTFSAGGKFAGQTVDDVAGMLRSGTLSAADVPINVVARNGQTFILNTRSSAALMRAGIPRSSWNILNQTGVSSFESMLTGQLGRNGLINGTNTIRQSGTQLILSQ